MIYKIRIILDTEEDIFRDIEIEDTNTLEELHNTIVQAFGFEGHEMASFYTCDEAWNQEEEIALFDMNEENASIRLMHETPLEEVLTAQSPKLIYLYDFLNMWTFFVELADITEKEDGRGYPNLLFSFGELPDTPPEKTFEPGEHSDEADVDELNFDDPEFDDPEFDKNWN